MSNSLREVHQRSLRSIAFPAIGTGQLGYPAKVVAAVAIGEILKFSLNNPQTTLRDVRFVVYPKDTKTIQVNVQYLQLNDFECYLTVL